MAVDIFQENFFIGWPGAAADDGGVAVTELLYFDDLFCIFRDLFYPVETGISCQSDIFYADGFQLFHRLPVLHEQFFEASQHPPVEFSPTFKKRLVGTENG